MFRIALCLGCLSFSQAFRIEQSIVSESRNRSEPEEIGWKTRHELDAAQSKKLHKVVHSEENCESCYQGDIALPPGTSLLELGSNESLKADGMPWPNGIIYYKWKPDIDPEAKKVTEQGMKYWEAKTCVEFKETTAQCRFYERSPWCYPVNMGSDEEGCHAHAGYHGASWQIYNLGDGCRQLGTALHELGHVLGLQHEQERFDRDEYVETILGNVEDGRQQWFKNKPWRTGAAKSLPYDLSSIMHYDGWAFAIQNNYNDKSTATIVVKQKDPWGNCNIGQRSHLSAGDILTVSAMYHCGDTYCVDRNSDCVDFAERDMCPGGSGGSAGNQEWMRSNCPASCGLCQCVDKAPDCNNYDMNLCPQGDAGTEGNRLWMKQNCAQSCGVCGPSDQSCQDKPFIPEWGKYHTCDKYSGGKRDSNGRLYCAYRMIQQACPRSCGTCPAQAFCPSIKKEKKEESWFFR